MSTIELKKQLIDKIQLIDNEDLLKEASRLIDIELEEVETPYPLTEEMTIAVSKARNQIENGDFLTHTEANKEIDTWFVK